MHKLAKKQNTLDGKYEDILSGGCVWQTGCHGRFIEEDQVRKLSPMQPDRRAGAYKVFIVLFTYLFTFWQWEMRG